MTNFRYLPLCILLLLGHVRSFQLQDIPRSKIRTSISQRFVATSLAPEENATPSFRDRMLKGLQTDSPQKSPPKKFSLVKEVRTLQEFKTTVVDESGLVAVWFYAPWCRACKATAPGFFAMAKHHPEVKFVQVPVLEDNANLHQGLGVPSVPYVQLYHPTAGLVEEHRLTRKHLTGFHKRVQDYIEGSCSLERKEEWSSTSPYELVPKVKDLQ
jgi:thiol-disulfide isomerase/thioredoxin